MQEIKSILCPTDFSNEADNALRYCLRLADAYGAKVEVLHVLFPEFEGMDIAVLAAQSTKEKVIAARHRLKERVESVLAQVQLTYTFDHPPIVTSDIEVGNASSIIARVAARDEMDLIVMATRQEHNLLEKTFGSVTTAVLEHAPCPVWVIPGQAPYRPIDVVVYATDLVESDPYHIWKVGKVFDPLILSCGVCMSTRKSLLKNSWSFLT
jgi:nucleotide-binding universal stress UspA family protein